MRRLRLFPLVPRIACHGDIPRRLSYINTLRLAQRVINTQTRMIPGTYVIVFHYEFALRAKFRREMDEAVLNARSQALGARSLDSSGLPDNSSSRRPSATKCRTPNGCNI